MDNEYVHVKGFRSYLSYIAPIQEDVKSKKNKRNNASHYRIARGKMLTEIENVGTSFPSSTCLSRYWYPMKRENNRSGIIVTELRETNVLVATKLRQGYQYLLIL